MSVYTSKEFRDWLQRWDVTQRLSSSYYPRSNKRAEVAIKSAKRMIMSNVGPGGTLNTDRVARALLQHRNCPDPTTGLSPAQIIFGRTLRDHLPLQPDALHVRQEWRLDAKRREEALAHRHVLKHEQLSHGTKPLPPLKTGDLVLIQDQAAAKQPGKWTMTGRVVEDEGFDSYMIKVDGSNKVTKRNRRFLRKIIPYIQATDNPPELRHTSGYIYPSRQAAHPGGPPSVTQPTVPTPKHDVVKPQPSATRHQPQTPPARQVRANNTRKKERWTVAKKFANKTVVNPHPDQNPNIQTTDVIPDSDVISVYEDRDVSDVNEDQNVIDVNESQSNVNHFIKKKTNDTLHEKEAEKLDPDVSPPPILFSHFRPPPPGSNHDYAAMERTAQRLREEVSGSTP